MCRPTRDSMNLGRPLATPAARCGNSETRQAAQAPFKSHQHANSRVSTTREVIAIDQGSWCEPLREPARRATLQNRVARSSEKGRSSNSVLRC